MKLEAGKYYKTRDGRKAYVAAIANINEVQSTNRAVGFCNGVIVHWTCLGAYHGWSDKEHGLDLIAEWTEPEAKAEWDGLWVDIRGKRYAIKLEPME